MSPRNAKDLAELALGRAEAHPDRVAWHWSLDGLQDVELRTYGELAIRAQALAVVLAAETRPGDRVLITVHGLEFTDAFFACMLASRIAVPCSPPRPGRLDQRLASVIRDCRPALVLSTASQERSFQLLEEQGISVPVRFPFENWPTTGGASLPLPGAEALAFLQYTSGSTSDPKGVCVRHRQILANEQMICDAFGHTPDTLVAGWLPLHHDMGLIGNLLQPFWLGVTCHMMPPSAFLQSPSRWLKLISRTGATTSGGPDFGYSLCCKEISEEEMEGVDLSRWSVAFNGSEPVRAETLENFSSLFGPYGFRATSHFPCYGLAEATLFVTGGPQGVGGIRMDASKHDLARGHFVPGEGAEAVALISSGHVHPMGQLRLVDPDAGNVVSAGKVGEIQLRGPAVTDGYWHPESGAPEPDEERWLPTGDLGFFQGPELVVTGRHKDLIILAGRNLYPQDIEASARAGSTLWEIGDAAAFSVDVEGQERLILVVEVAIKKDAAPLEGMLPAIRARLSQDHEVRLERLVVVRRPSLPRTTSGKIRRRKCRELLLSGELPSLVDLG